MNPIRAAVPPAAIAALVLAAAGGALAVGSSGRLDDLADAVDQEAQSLEGLTDRGSVKTRKLLLKVDRILDGVSPEAAAAVELKAASKAAGLLERKLAELGELVFLAVDARDAFSGDVAARRDALAALVDGGILEGAALKSAVKRLAKADRFLEKANGAIPLKSAFKFLGKAAAQVEDLPVGGGDLSATWVVDSLGFAPTGVGYDFDGNGTPNNALGSIFALVGDLGGGVDLDAAVQAAVDDGSLILILDMWDVADWNGDPSVMAGVLPGVDTDADPSDNFSGAEAFQPGAPLAPDGHPILRGGAALESGGAYEASVPLPELPAGILDLPLTGPVVLAGSASPAANTGLLAFAMTPEAVVDLAVAANPDQEETIRSFSALIAALADVDTDGNGTKDALSGALAFTAVPCAVVLP